MIVALSNFVGWDQLLCNAGALDHLTLEPTPATLTVPTYPAATTGVGGNNASVYLPELRRVEDAHVGARGPPAARQRRRRLGRRRASGSAPGLDRKGTFTVGVPGDVVAGALGRVPAPRRGRHRRRLVVAEQPLRQRRGVGGRAARSSTSTAASGPAAAAPAGGAAATRWRPAWCCTAPTRCSSSSLASTSRSTAPSAWAAACPATPATTATRPASSPPSSSATAGWPARAASSRRSLGGLRRIFAKEMTTLRPGDVFVAQYNGGGGFGDPLARDSAARGARRGDVRDPPRRGLPAVRRRARARRLGGRRRDGRGPRAAAARAPGGRRRTPRHA